jgi:hypothetical protein
MSKNKNACVLPLRPMLFSTSPTLKNAIPGIPSHYATTAVIDLEESKKTKKINRNESSLLASCNLIQQARSPARFHSPWFLSPPQHQFFFDPLLSVRIILTRRNHTCSLFLLKPTPGATVSFNDVEQEKYE